MGSAVGVRKQAAGRVGLTSEQYQALVDAGQKWCGGCRTWHDRDAFNVDRSRGDGLGKWCRVIQSLRSRAVYVRRPRPAAGRRFTAARDGDQGQARRRVNHLINVGVLSPPNAFPCADCEHVWGVGERRHEYDHYLGYAAGHHEDVQPVCTTCHRLREIARRAAA